MSIPRDSALRRSLVAAAFALPVIGLGVIWVLSYQRSLQGTVWEVPVLGYDPRDLLRGHYIEYTYDWPGLEDGEVPGPGSMICLQGEAPRIDSIDIVRTGDPCPRPLRAAAGDTLLAGRLYIPQEKASDLEERLADPALRGIVRLRVQDHGRFRPIDIRFEPLPPPAVATDDGTPAP